MYSTTVGSHLPPPLTERTSILIWQILLPPVPYIAWTKFVPRQETQDPQKAIELARQSIVNDARQLSQNIPNSLLPDVHIGDQEVTLWVFAIGSYVGSGTAQEDGKGKKRGGNPVVEVLEALEFHDLERCQLSRFSPVNLYPCSEACAQSLCSSCARAALDPAATRGTFFPSQSTLLPRISLRAVYRSFIAAVRAKLIDDICTASCRTVGTKNSADLCSQSLRPTRPAIRLGNGFISYEVGAVSSWGYGREHKSRHGLLTHTTLKVELLSTTILIRFFPSVTTLQTLLVPVIGSPSTSYPTTSSSPPFTMHTPALTSGCPLVLSPYSTPAFYVSTHTRAVAASLGFPTQFWAALAGLGVAPCPPGFFFHSSEPISASSNSSTQSPGVSAEDMCHESFVLVIIPLIDLQEPLKGIPALWPAHLVFIDTSPTRFPLKHLPDMPGMETILTPPRPHKPSSASQQPAIRTPIPLYTQRFDHPSAEVAHRVQHTFRTLELLSHRRATAIPVSVIAEKVAGYVKSVVKERAKERERIIQERMRREGELKDKSGPDVPALVFSGALSPKPDPVMTYPVPTSNSTLSTFFAKLAQRMESEPFYHSPSDPNGVFSHSNTRSSEPSLSHNPPITLTTSSLASDPLNHPSVPSGAMWDRPESYNSINMGANMAMTGVSLTETMPLGIDVDALGIMDDTFGSFTDEDFKFFDSAPLAASIASAVPYVQHPLHTQRPNEDVVEEWLPHGAPAVTNQDGNADLINDQLRLHGEPDVLQHIAPTFTTIDTAIHEASIAPEVQMFATDDSGFSHSPPDLLSSSSKTPRSPDKPRTPLLEVASPVPTAGRFDPIIFGKSHRVADIKYENPKGKFFYLNTSRMSLRSKISPGYHSSSISETDDGWRSCYDAMTDPRVGIINHLRGVKRKLSQAGDHPNIVKGSHAREEWTSIYEHEQAESVLTESSSDEESDEVDAEDPEPQPLCGGGDASKLGYRPSRSANSPPPPALPMVPELLYSHFHHSHILPMGISMYSLHVGSSPHDDASTSPVTLPTPVSPVAKLGGAAGLHETPELIAQTIAKEAVENSIWTEAWISSSDAAVAQICSKTGRRVSQRDLKWVSDMIGRVDGLQGPLSLSSLLEPSLLVASSEETDPTHTKRLQLMHPPWLSIGRHGLVHHVSPPALRFWEKIGLGPRGGVKNVVAFALFEEGDGQSELVEKWLERVSKGYSAYGFGSHVAGSAGSFDRGLVPLRFETVHKTFPNLISALPTEPGHIVIYVIAPADGLSLESTVLRTIINIQNPVAKLAGQHDFDQDRILFHFVPDYLVADPHAYLPTTQRTDVKRFVTSVYNRLSRPTLRQTSRQPRGGSISLENRFQVPAYVLARTLPLETHFQWRASPDSLNVLDRHTFLHVGYCFSQCKKWLLAACIDERGEAHDIAVWDVSSRPRTLSMNTWTVSNIWIFARQFWQRADTEWRVAVAKLGALTPSEAKEWMSHLQTILAAHTGPPIHVSLVCAQSDVALPFLCTSGEPESSPPLANTETLSNSVFADVSSMTYGAFFSRPTLIVPSGTIYSSEQMAPLKPKVAEDMIDDVPPCMGILPLCTTALFQVPNEMDMGDISTLYIHLVYADRTVGSTLKKTTEETHEDLTRNWYDLVVLTRERWSFGPQYGELPFHLGALEVMSKVLDPLEITPNEWEVEYLDI